MKRKIDEIKTEENKQNDEIEMEQQQSVESMMSVEEQETMKEQNPVEEQELKEQQEVAEQQNPVDQLHSKEPQNIVAHVLHAVDQPGDIPTGNLRMEQDQANMASREVSEEPIHLDQAHSQNQIPLEAEQMHEESVDDLYERQRNFLFNLRLADRYSTMRSQRRGRRIRNSNSASVYQGNPIIRSVVENAVNMRQSHQLSPSMYREILQYPLFSFGDTSFNLNNGVLPNSLSNSTFYSETVDNEISRRANNYSRMLEIPINGMPFIVPHSSPLINISRNPNLSEFNFVDNLNDIFIHGFLSCPDPSLVDSVMDGSTWAPLSSEQTVNNIDLAPEEGVIFYLQLVLTWVLPFDGRGFVLPLINSDCPIDMIFVHSLETVRNNLSSSVDIETGTIVSVPTLNYEPASDENNTTFLLPSNVTNVMVYCIPNEQCEAQHPKKEVKLIIRKRLSSPPDGLSNNPDQPFPDSGREIITEQSQHDFNGSMANGNGETPPAENGGPSSDLNGFGEAREIQNSIGFELAHMFEKSKTGSSGKGYQPENGYFNGVIAKIEEELQRLNKKGSAINQRLRINNGRWLDMQLFADKQPEVYQAVLLLRIKTEIEPGEMIDQVCAWRVVRTRDMKLNYLRRFGDGEQEGPVEMIDGDSGREDSTIPFNILVNNLINADYNDVTFITPLRMVLRDILRPCKLAPNECRLVKELIRYWLLPVDDRFLMIPKVFSENDTVHFMLKKFPEKCIREFLIKSGRADVLGQLFEMRM